MIKKTSGFDSFDFLNQKTAIPNAPKPSQTKFGSAITSINDLMKTATDTLVTVDGVINQGSKKKRHTQTPTSLYPGQGTPVSSGSDSMMKYAAIAGITLGGGIILLKFLKK